MSNIFVDDLSDKANLSEGIKSLINDIQDLSDDELNISGGNFFNGGFHGGGCGRGRGRGRGRDINIIINNRNGDDDDD